MYYDYKMIEEKWQKYWEEHNTYYCDTHDFSKPKFYALDMFPYPSGEGLHVGHPEGYTATDIVSRMKRAQGYNVLHPMGFDSFGLPAEQYAIKTGNHPDGFTQKNIQTFTKQLKMLGFSFDWSKVVSTCDPKFYKWTQWIFKQLFLDGLARNVNMPVNWCEELGTVLANDEVIDGKSERGGFPVVKKDMLQWVLDIPKYSERLLSQLDELDWPSSTKEIQRNWIGKSTGAEIEFKIKDLDKSFIVFTTRADTLFGATYCVLSPEHKLIKEIVTEDKKVEVEQYIKEASFKSDIERTESKEKTGVFIGRYAINPVNNKLLPIYISDYVLSTYGTGAIMAVPAHDDRDYEFAKKFNIEIIQVLEGGDISKEAYTGEGIHINSEFLNGLNKQDATSKMIAWLEAKGIGKKKINYKMREWIFARQRYWGEPLPIIYQDGKTIALSDSELPLVLPEVDNYGRSKDGKSPLENSPWINTTYNGKPARRESSTMPGSAGSAWYFFRYIDPNNDKAFCDYELMKHWMPVDLYLGGAEHAVGHLLYSRFWTNFLYDKGLSPVKEPFKKLFHQGMILGSNGEKMSKSRGNVVNPDDVVRDYGADSLRLYEMFMGPLEASLPWSVGGLDGAKRFIERVFRLVSDPAYIGKLVDTNDGALDYVYNFTVKKVTEDYEALQFNTAISQMMILTNEIYKQEKIYKPYVEGLVQLLAPIIPHVGEEMWELLGHKEIIDYVPWPKVDESKLVLDEINIAVQFNGKLKNVIKIKKDLDDEEVKKIVLDDDIIKEKLNGLTVRKIIVVKNKIVNIVVG